MTAAAAEAAEDDRQARAELRTEIGEYLGARQERRRLFPRAALVGLCAGLVAVGFRYCLEGGDHLRAALLAAAHQRGGVALLLPVFVAALAAGFAVYLVRRFAPETSGSGIPHLEAVLRQLRRLHWQRVLAVKFGGGALAIGAAGLALGREGPTVQMGGAVGDAVARALGAKGHRDREALITAGAGAGLAAAFNAPLSGVVFVLEEVTREFTPLVFGAALIACVVADVVTRLLAGQAPVFRIPAYGSPSLGLLPAFVLLGALAGVLGVVFNRSLVGTLNLFARLRRVPSWASAAGVAAVGALLAFRAPQAQGGGHGLTEAALVGRVALGAVPLWFVVRFALTMAGYGTGAPGGIFAPMLALGALLGLAVGRGAHFVSPDLAPLPGVFAVVGMAAYFTAVVRAPLTGIVLIVEMTGSYALMLPLLAACLTAYVVAEALGDRPIYEVLLERDLMRGRDTAVPEPEHREPQVLTFRVQEGAPYAGRAVRELGLPPGCILVARRRGFEESVPTAATVLTPGDRVTVLVAPEVTDGARLLRRGFEEEKPAGATETGAVTESHEGDGQREGDGVTEPEGAPAEDEEQPSRAETADASRSTRG
jgi:CIC family chloride channel protein